MEYYGYYGIPYYGLLRNITDRNISPLCPLGTLQAERLVSKFLPAVVKMAAARHSIGATFVLIHY